MGIIFDPIDLCATLIARDPPILTSKFRYQCFDININNNNNNTNNKNNNNNNNNTNNNNTNNKNSNNNM